LIQVRVPPRFQEPLQELARLDSDRRSAIVGSLTEAKAFTPLHDLADRVSEAIGVTHEDGLGIVLALLSFNIQLGAWNEPASVVAKSVAESGDLGLDDEERSNLTAALNELLDAHSLSTAAKAADLMTEHENVYSAVRVITDLRPVFGEDPSADPAGVTLSATLKLDHYNDGRIKSLYVAVDEEDLRAIRDAVDRALKKSETISKLMKANKMPIYRADREEP
jgi:hypothetical protein